MLLTAALAASTLALGGHLLLFTALVDTAGALVAVVGRALSRMP